MVAHQHLNPAVVGSNHALVIFPSSTPNVFVSVNQTPESLPIVFGANTKAHLAAKTVFGLAHRHGDILAEGWKNLLDCMLQLYRAKLLPIEMIEVQDFVDPSGRVSLIREEMPAVK